MNAFRKPAGVLFSSTLSTLTGNTFCVPGVSLAYLANLLLKLPKRKPMHLFKFLVSR